MTRTDFPENYPHVTKALLHPRYWLQWLGQGILWLIVQLPFPWIMQLGRGLGWLSMKILPRRVHIARTNFAMAFPEKSEAEREAMLKENFANVGRAIFETAIAWYWPDERVRRIMHIQGQEFVEQAVANGQGMLLLSAHFMTLELNARMFGLLRPGVGVYRPNNNPVLEFAQYRGRCKSNKYLVSRDDVKGMIKALRHGDALWYAADHDYGPHASVFVPFFAVPDAATVIGTATLAKVKNCVVLPCYNIRRSTGGYDLIIEAPITNFPTGDHVVDATRTNQVIEHAVRKAPEQYMWLHRRFKSRPDGSKFRYKPGETR